MENQNTTESQEKVTISESTISPIDTLETRSGEKRARTIDELEEDLKRLKLENQILEESNRYKERLQPQIGKSSRLNEFFWWCAGVDKEIIRQCPTDHAKYVGIGGTILFTAVMATLSAGYALSTVFNDHPYVAICFGIIWGLSIFNLDRFIVNTMYSDGKANISWLEFRSGLPRIIMAIFLGVVISTPLELKIFEDEISIVIREQIQDRIRDYQALDTKEKARVEYERDSLSHYLSELFNRPIIPDIVYGSNQKVNEWNAKIQELQNGLKVVQDDINRIESELKNVKGRRSQISKKILEADSIQKIELEKQITKLDIQIGKLNDDHKSKKNIEADKNREIAKISSQISAESEEGRKALQDAQKRKDQEIARIKNDIATKDTIIISIKAKIDNDGYAKLIEQEYGGFQAKMNAFSKMKKENESTNISSLFIMLLFVIIETAPTFFKMMMEDGPYDHLKHAKMAETKALAIKLESLTNDDINTELSISQARNQRRLEAEMKANEDVMDKIADTQSELIKTSIALWREEELKKIKENPTIYLKQNNEKG